MYGYNISSRILTRNSAIIAKPLNALSTPYSGTHAGRNNPAMCNVPQIGPLPAVRYRIGRSHYSENTGRVTFDLTPFPGVDVFGRSLFRIHGNDKQNDASHGCLILDYDVRVEMAKVIDSAAVNDDDTILEVMAA